MSITKTFSTMVLAAGLAAMTSVAWAQGETPRPQTSNPSATVNQLMGLPPPPVGAPGNPSGNAADRTAIQPPANVRPTNPSNVQGNLGSQGTENRPASPTRSQPSSPTN